MSYWIETASGRFLNLFANQQGPTEPRNRKNLGPATRSLLDNGQISAGGVEQVVAECDGHKDMAWLADALRDVTEGVVIVGGPATLPPGQDEESNPESSEIVLPDISMRPKDMVAVTAMLSLCNQQAQEIFRFLMEKWTRAGFVVGRTARAIVLDAPAAAPHANRIAMLMPGDSSTPGSGPAGICLFWENLRSQKQFPSAAVDTYQAKVRKIAQVRETASSAHIRVDESLDHACVVALLEAMKVLARAIRPELAEAPATSKPVTPTNLRETLAMCAPDIQKVFAVLVEGWEAAGGTVQAKQAGRIYLRMKTKRHSSGNYARLPRNFNILVLAAPKGKLPAHIQATWGLTNYYLDCIPSVVQKYEGVVEGLPDFNRTGTLSRVMMSGNFLISHAETLLKTVLAVKAAEEKAP